MLSDKRIYQTEYSLSGQQVKKRQELMQSRLHEEFEECRGEEVDQKGTSVLWDQELAGL